VYCGRMPGNTTKAQILDYRRPQNLPTPAPSSEDFFVDDVATRLRKSRRWLQALLAGNRD
jgi:hypothetical protein